MWRGPRGGVGLTGRMQPSDSKGCPDASGQASSARQAAQEPLPAGCRTESADRGHRPPRRRRQRTKKNQPWPKPV